LGLNGRPHAQKHCEIPFVGVDAQKLNFPGSYCHENMLVLEGRPYTKKHCTLPARWGGNATQHETAEMHCNPLSPRKTQQLQKCRGHSSVRVHIPHIRHTRLGNSPNAKTFLQTLRNRPIIQRENLRQYHLLRPSQQTMLGMAAAMKQAEANSSKKEEEKRRKENEEQQHIAVLATLNAR